MDASEQLIAVANAISEGINYLCALLEWIDTGATEAPPLDGVTLGKAMTALAEAMREVLYGGRLDGGPPVTEENLTRVLRLEELFAEWTSTGALSPEVTTLAALCVSELCGGVTWRELMTMARRQLAPTR